MKLETDIENYKAEITKEMLEIGFEGSLELAKKCKEKIDENSTEIELTSIYNNQWLRYTAVARSFKTLLEKYDKKYLANKEKDQKYLDELGYSMHKVLTNIEAN